MAALLRISAGPRAIRALPYLVAAGFAALVAWAVRDLRDLLD
jgi:hypothetical protein